MRRKITRMAYQLYIVSIPNAPCVGSHNIVVCKVNGSRVHMATKLTGRPACPQVHAKGSSGETVPGSGLSHLQVT